MTHSVWKSGCTSTASQLKKNPSEGSWNADVARGQSSRPLLPHHQGSASADGCALILTRPLCTLRHKRGLPALLHVPPPGLHVSLFFVHEPPFVVQPVRHGNAVYLRLVQKLLFFLWTTGHLGFKKRLHTYCILLTSGKVWVFPHAGKLVFAVIHCSLVAFELPGMNKHLAGE